MEIDLEEQIEKGLTEQEQAKAKREFMCCVAETQTRVLREMYPRFGLKNAPPELEIKPLPHIPGGFLCESDEGKLSLEIGLGGGIEAFVCGRDFGFDSWREWLKAREYVTAHECGHYLHRVAKPLEYKRLIWDKNEGERESRPWFLMEAIAELCSLEYAQNLGRLNEVLFHASDYPPFYRIWTLFNEEKDILPRLVEMDFRDALRVIEPYYNLKEPSYFSRFRELSGMFVHVEEIEEAA